MGQATTNTGTVKATPVSTINVKKPVVFAGGSPEGVIHAAAAAGHPVATKVSQNIHLANLAS